MHPLQIHDLARDRQATLLAEAARERLARGGTRFDAAERPSFVTRLAAALRGRLNRSRNRGSVATPRSA